MKRRLFAATALLVAVSTQIGAQAAPVPTDHVAVVAAGGSAAWTGKPAHGANLNYHGVVPTSSVPGKFTCSTTDVTRKCETVLLTLTNPFTDAEKAANKPSKSRAFTITLKDFSPVAPTTDVDLTVWASDADGRKLDPSKPTYTSGCACAPLLNSGYSSVTFDEQVVGQVTTLAGQDTFHFLLEIPYFYAVNGSYKGNITF